MIEPAMLQEMLAQAARMRDRSYAPYSDYEVGAVVMGKSGRLYAGCNIENAAYGSSMCAERVAIYKAISEGEFGIRAVVITGAGEELPHPCGACLQVMSEFDLQNEPVYIVVECNGHFEVNTLADYLPMPFRFEV